MPRLARLDSPGILHHIIIRGIERRVIFRDDLDRANFLERMSILIPETQSVCYAWVFMANQKRAWLFFLKKVYHAKIVISSIINLSPLSISSELLV